MLRLQAAIVFLLGFMTLVACAPYEAFQPEKSEGTFSAKGKLSETQEAELRRTFLCDDGCTMDGLELGSMSPAKKIAFLKSIDEFDTKRYKVKGITVEKNTSVAGHRSSESPSSNVFKVGLVVVMGQDTRFFEFSGELKYNQSAEKTHPIEQLKLVDEGRVKAANSDAGMTPEGEETNEILDEIGEDEAAKRIAEDKKRPVSAYVSCGKDKACAKAVVLLQFVSDVSSKDYKKTLVTDPKVSIIVSSKENGEMKIESTTVGTVRSFAEAKKAAEGKPDPEAGLTAAEREKLELIEDCVGDKVKEAQGEVSEDDKDQFRVDCIAKVNKDLEEQADLRELVKLKDLEPQVEACVLAEESLSEDELDSIIEACEVSVEAERSPVANSSYEKCVEEEAQKIEMTTRMEPDGPDMERIRSICEAKAAVETSTIPEEDEDEDEDTEEPVVTDSEDSEAEENSGLNTDIDLQSHPDVRECVLQKSMAEGVRGSSTQRFLSSCIDEFNFESKKLERQMSYQGQINSSAEGCIENTVDVNLGRDEQLQVIQKCKFDALVEYMELDLESRKAAIVVLCEEYFARLDPEADFAATYKDQCEAFATREQEALDIAHPWLGY